MGKENMAFKCNYNNGGKSRFSYGYKNICNDGVIEYNIKKAKSEWCCNSECPCNQYYKKKITKAELIDQYSGEGCFVCYESALLRDWIIRAGVDHGEAKNGPRAIRNADIGGLAILTVVLPDMPEFDRRIFGVFTMDDIFEGDEENEGFVASTSKFRIELTPSETNDLKFWDYYSNENSPDRCHWGTGLFRYIYDLQAAQILEKLVQIKTGTQDENLAKELLSSFCRRKHLSIGNLGELSLYQCNRAHSGIFALNACDMPPQPA